MANIKQPIPKYNSKRQRWELQIQRKGKRKMFISKLPPNDFLGAIKECASAFEKWQAQNKQIKSVERFGDVWPMYLAHYREQVRATSYEQKASIGRVHILPQLKTKKLTELSKQDWQGVLDTAYKNGVKSREGLKGIRSVLLCFAKWCAVRGFLADPDVPIYLEIPAKANKRGAKRALSSEELKFLFSEKAETCFFIEVYRFFVLTGLRRGELCALRLEDLAGRYLTIERTLTRFGEGQTKTQSGQRKIYLSTPALKALNAHQQKTEAGPRLFRQRNGLTINPATIHFYFDRWRKEHKLKVTLHELRHTFISYTRQKTGLDLEQLKKLYGHSKDMNTDAVYVHALELSAEERQAIEKQDSQIAAKIASAFAGITS